MVNMKVYIYIYVTIISRLPWCNTGNPLTLQLQSEASDWDEKACPRPLYHQYDHHIQLRMWFLPHLSAISYNQPKEFQIYYYERSAIVSLQNNKIELVYMRLCNSRFQLHLNNISLFPYAHYAFPSSLCWWP